MNRRQASRQAPPRAPSRAPPRLGRKCHNSYEGLNFLSVKLENGRRAARCRICHIVLKNTTISRLEIHRKNCTGSPKSNPEEESIMIVCDNSENYDENMTVEEKSNSTKEDSIEEFIIPDFEADESDTDSKEQLYLNYVEEADSSDACTSDSASAASPSRIDKLNPEVAKTTKRKNEEIVMIYPKKISQFVDILEPKVKREIDMALAKFFFGCNIPFAVIDSDHFKNFIKKIRPSYTAPCRQTLSTTLLDDVSNEIMETNEKCLTKETSLLIDGQKDSANNLKNVVTMLQAVGSQSTFLESYDFSDYQEIGEILPEICQSSARLAKEQYGCEVYAVVSDNADMLNMERATNLWHITCSSHMGNLLAKDILNVDAVNKMNAVLEEFKQTHLEELLISNGGTRIILPDETRWCSQRESCRCFIKNLLVMKKISTESSIKIKPEVVYLLYDDKFINSIRNIIHILDPVCALVNKCKKKDFSIADAAEEWLNLQKMIPDDLITDEILSAITRRFEIATNIYNLAANSLHPQYRGQGLTREQHFSVKNFFIDNLDNDGLDGLIAFERRLDIFQKLYEKNVTSWNTFWNFAETRFSSLATLAQKLLNIPASSAKLGKMFSDGSFAHSTLRNRLTLDKSSKLVFVYYSLKLKDSNISD